MHALHRPYEHTNPDVAYVTSFPGYLTHRLTGEFKDNIANYFGQWPVDYKSWAWSENAAVMEKFNIPRQMLLTCKCQALFLGISHHKLRWRHISGWAAGCLYHR